MLAENLEHLRALDLYENPEYSGQLDSERLFDLVMMATGDERKARAAMQARATSRMDHGERP